MEELEIKAYNYNSTDEEPLAFLENYGSEMISLKTISIDSNECLYLRPDYSDLSNPFKQHPICSLLEHNF